MEPKSILPILLYFWKLYAHCSAATNAFKIEYKWSQIEFDFATDEEREEAINNGTFRVGTVQPADVQPYYHNASESGKTVFVTCLRIHDGVPLTFGYVTDKRREGNPIVAPYLNWEWQTNPRMCKKLRIVSVYRVFIDGCHRLWVVDSGVIGDDQVCAPQILIFDLKTNSLVRQYEIPFEQYRNKALYITPTVETNSNNCENAFSYLADCDAYSLLVYDYKNNKSWRITSNMTPTFLPDPNYEEYNVDGIKVKIMDGVFGLALSPPGPDRKLFYHAMTSGSENWVYTKYLKNEALFSTGMDVRHLFHTYPNTRGDQSAAEAMDKSGNLYFGLIGEIKIASWNIEQRVYGRKYFRIVGNDQKTMQFPSGLKIVTDNSGREIIWIFGNAYQRLATNSLSLNQTNFHILSAKVKDLKTLK